MGSVMAAIKGQMDDKLKIDQINRLEYDVMDLGVIFVFSFWKKWKRIEKNAIAEINIEYEKINLKCQATISHFDEDYRKSTTNQVFEKN